MNRTCVAIVLAGTAAMVAVGTASADPPDAPPTTVEAPAAEPIINGPLTVTLVDAHYSEAASQLVVVLEISATATVAPRALDAVYVGPDGQQVEVTDYIEPETVFVGATALSVMVFPAATPGGTVMYYAYADDVRLDVTIPVTVAEAAVTTTVPAESLPGSPEATAAGGASLPTQTNPSTESTAPSTAQPLTVTTEVDTDRDGLSDTDEASCCDPNDPDTDDDGLSDGDEVHIWNTSAGFTDSDNDNLSDYEEVIDFGSNPNLEDADNDGLRDDSEQYFETDPNDPDTDGDGYNDHQEFDEQTDPNDPADHPSCCPEPTQPPTTPPAVPPPPTGVVAGLEHGDDSRIAR